MKRELVPKWLLLGDIKDAVIISVKIKNSSRIYFACDDHIIVVIAFTPL